MGTDPLLVFVHRGSSPEDVLARLTAPHGGRAMRAQGPDLYLLELPRAGVEAFFRELSGAGRPFARETAPPADYDCALLFVGVRRE